MENVENVEITENWNHFFVLIGFVFPFKHLPENDGCRLLALFDCSAELFGLFERQPAGIGICHGVQEEGVDASIVFASDEISGNFIDRCPRFRPRQFSSGFNAFNDPVCDDLIDLIVAHDPPFVVFE